MNIYQFLKNNSFDNIKNIITNKPYNLIIKEDNDFPDLYMITYKRGISNLNNELVNQCRGLIIEKSTNKIICYTFNKSEDHSENNNFNWNDYQIQRSIDGTQIRLFYYNDKWNVATTRCIDAKKSFWSSNKSFYDLFIETIPNFPYDKLNINYSYAFVLCHPENKIVINYDQAKIYHVLTRDLETLSEIECDIGIEKPEIISEKFENILNDMNDVSDLKFEGFMLCDNQYQRIKIKYNYYNNIKELLYNTNNKFFRYLNLKYDKKILNYLNIFKEDTELFNKFKKEINNLVYDIYKNYINLHIKKINKINDIPEHYRKIIYNLHGIYLSNHQKITLDIIHQEINKLHPKIVCDLYNKTYKN